MITRGDVQYEGSIEIPADLMAAVDLWPGEKVLVASVTSGNRLETYALQGPAGTGNIIMNGGAAPLTKTANGVVNHELCPVGQAHRSQENRLQRA